MNWINSLTLKKTFLATARLIAGLGSCRSPSQVGIKLRKRKVNYAVSIKQVEL